MHELSWLECLWSIDLYSVYILSVILTFPGNIINIGFNANDNYPETIKTFSSQKASKGGNNNQLKA